MDNVGIITLIFAVVVNIGTVGIITRFVFISKYNYDRMISLKRYCEKQMEIIKQDRENEARRSVDTHKKR